MMYRLPASGRVSEVVIRSPPCSGNHETLLWKISIVEKLSRDRRLGIQRARRQQYIDALCARLCHFRRDEPPCGVCDLSVLCAFLTLAVFPIESVSRPLIAGSGDTF